MSKLTVALMAFSSILAATNAAANYLGPNNTLQRGQSIKSSTGNYMLSMQTDGTLAMYRQDGTKRYGMANNGLYAIMQSDGNFVEYGSFSALWNTGTQGNPNSILAIQDDGNLVVYSATGVPLWNIGAEPSPGDPTKIGDVVGRDFQTIGFLGHLALFDGSGVVEANTGGYNAIRYLSLNQFKSATVFWGTASSKIPNETVSVDCGMATCYHPATPWQYYVSTRQAITRRAYQIYLLGADYTSTTYVTRAYPGSQYGPGQRGSYRCDTFVLDAVRDSTRGYMETWGAWRPKTPAGFEWERRFFSLYNGIMAPRPVFDGLRSFQ